LSGKIEAQGLQLVYRLSLLETPKAWLSKDPIKRRVRRLLLRHKREGTILKQENSNYPILGGEGTVALRKRKTRQQKREENRVSWRSQREKGIKEQKGKGVLDARCAKLAPPVKGLKREGGRILILQFRGSDGCFEGRKHAT